MQQLIQTHTQPLQGCLQGRSLLRWRRAQNHRHSSNKHSLILTPAGKSVLKGHKELSGPSWGQHTLCYGNTWSRKQHQHSYIHRINNNKHCLLSSCYQSWRRNVPTDFWHRQHQSQESCASKWCIVLLLLFCSFVHLRGTENCTTRGHWFSVWPRLPGQERRSNKRHVFQVFQCLSAVVCSFVF